MKMFEIYGNNGNKRQPLILGLPGSLRPGSHTRQALKIALAGAQMAGAKTKLLDLRDYDLPFSNGNLKDPNLPQDVLRLRTQLREADGLIIGTPEYHGGMSGVLKNAIDLMTSKEFDGKLVGLLGVSGGQMGATNALNSLRTVALSLHAWVTPKQVSISQAWRQFDEDGRLHDENIKKRLIELGQEVAHYTTLHHPDIHLSPLTEWAPGAKLKI